MKFVTLFNKYTGRGVRAAVVRTAKTFVQVTFLGGVHAEKTYRFNLRGKGTSVERYENDFAGYVLGKLHTEFAPDTDRLFAALSEVARHKLSSQVAPVESSPLDKPAEGPEKFAVWDAVNGRWWGGGRYTVVVRFRSEEQATRRAEDLTATFGRAFFVRELGA